MSAPQITVIPASGAKAGIQLHALSLGLDSRLAGMTTAGAA